MKDPIIQELYDIKDRMAWENDNDIEKLVEKLRKKEKFQNPVTIVKSKNVKKGMEQEDS